MWNKKKTFVDVGLKKKENHISKKKVNIFVAVCACVCVYKME